MFTWMLAVSLVVGGAAQRQTVTVDRVIIVGNRTVSDAVIRRAVGIYPGDLHTAKTLRLAERHLLRLGVFECDPERGIRPTITVVPVEGQGPRDIVIQVREAQPLPK
jgi:outer membrane protein assembly factor BamA